MKGFFAEFKEFAVRGNAVDLAVGIVVGSAFNSIVNAFVTYIITPPVGLFLGKVNFKDLAFALGGTVKIEYGLFLQAVVSFLITVFLLFLFIRFMNHLPMRKKKKEEEPAKTPELLVLEEIRDSLRPKV